MRRAGTLGLSVAMAAALAMAAAPAYAVDVDRIEIRSRLGEPLLAEIPITGATPQELEQLGAQLASSTTFARIGLPRPSGVVADLRFEVVRGPRPVIRVTSTLPVQEEFLTFLVQVEAPQGRLVREYSLALGASPSLPAALPPPIQAPVAAADSAIARQPQPVQDPANALPAPVEPEIQAPQAVPPVPVVASPPPSPPPIPLKGDAPRAAPAPAPARAAARPAPSTAPGTVAPAPRSRSAVPATTAPTTRAPAPQARSGGYVVQRGDNLSRVVERMDFSGATPQQAMLALLRTNPQAFGSGNINLLRQGAVLQRPPTAELRRLDAAAAEALVRLQIQQWRSGEMPPVAATGAPAPADAPAAAGDPAAETPKMAPPRLEIAPAAEAEAQQAASGAGGAVGDDPAARERAAAELVAARYTEFQQMQQRIAELEQAQKAQQRLLELKDRQLAAQRPQSAGVWPWLVAALAVLVAIGALWRGRRVQPRSGPVARRLSAMVGARSAADATASSSPKGA